MVRLRGLRGSLQGRRRAAPVARGTTYDIANQPIDYLPYDQDYHDVNRVMGSDQKKPPVTIEQQRKQREASRTLAKESVNAYTDILGSMYHYPQQRARVAGQAIWEIDSEQGAEPGGEADIAEDDAVRYPLNAWVRTSGRSRTRGRAARSRGRSSGR